MLRGLKFLHKNNIVHCDVKLRNLLVFLDNNGEYCAKVADLGLATGAKGETLSHGMVCPFHAPPESALGTKRNISFTKMPIHFGCNIIRPGLVFLCSKPRDRRK